MGADTIVSTDTTQDGGIFSVADNSVLLITDPASDPTLTLIDGATASWEGATVVGSLDGESGNLVIQSGSTVSNAGAFTVLGTYGSWSVTRGSGQIGLNTGSLGEVLVTGSGSQWTNSGGLHVGRGGTGRLEIAAGGAVSSSIANIGSFSDGMGEVLVTGGGSNWNSSNLNVGASGTGSLKIIDGGAVSTGFGYVGNFAGSTGEVLVTGSGSQWTNSSNLHVANSGTGTLEIAEGGAVSNTTGYIALDSGSAGEVVVTGSGSQWNNSSRLFAGGEGTAALTVSDGGQVSAQSLYADLLDLHGDGTIVTNGILLDYDVVINSSQGLQQTFAFGSGGELHINLDGTGVLGGWIPWHWISYHRGWSCCRVRWFFKFGLHWHGVRFARFCLSHGHRFTVDSHDVSHHRKFGHGEFGNRRGRGRVEHGG